MPFANRSTQLINLNSKSMDYSGKEYAPSSSSRRPPRRVSLCSTSTVDVSRDTDRSTFPFKLYAMLEYASNHGLASIVWTHDGEAFEIIDADALMDDVAPLFFKQTKFRSFTRESISLARTGTNSERPTDLSANVSQVNSIFGVSTASRTAREAGGTTTSSGATSTGSL